MKLACLLKKQTKKDPRGGGGQGIKGQSAGDFLSGGTGGSEFLSLSLP